VKRGDVVVVSAPGDYAKPRPAVVVQSDLFNDTHASIAVCLLTTDLVDAPLFRLTVDPAPGNGIERRSQIMIDKIVALRRRRIARRVGALDADTLLRVNRSLALWLGLGD
jgi:mRNA interferase MazF